MQARLRQEAIVGVSYHMLGEALSLSLTHTQNDTRVNILCCDIHPGPLPRISATSPVVRGELRDSSAETLFAARY